MPAFKPVAFEPSARRRSGARVPPWLVLLLLGAALGVAGVIGVQERVLPPRLSAGEAAALRAALSRAEAERDRLSGQLATTSKRLEAALQESKTATADLAADRERNRDSRADFAFLVDALPPDPRAGAVEVRAARFADRKGALGYEVLLTRDKATAATAAVMQFAVSSKGNPGAERTVTLDPVPLSAAAQQILRGSLPLPEAFGARMVTVRVLDRAGGKLLGMRVLYVR
jgi:hypothetical protein